MKSYIMLTSHPIKNLLRKLLVPLLTLASFSISHATVYYVDSVNGNDSNAGTTTNTAWKTTYNPNNGWPKGTAFRPGDQILFKCGDVWGNATNLLPASTGTGQQLVCHYSGSSGNPIVYGSYGTGANPIIYAAAKYSSAILITGTSSYITVENFTVENYDGTNISDGAEDNRSGIQVGTYPDILSNIIIQNNTIENVEGCSNAPTAAHPRGSSIASSYSECQYSCAALYVHGNQVNNLTLNGNTIDNCTGTGIYVEPNNAAGCQNLLVENNTVNNVGDDGICVLGAVSPVVESNICVDAGNNDPNAYTPWPATNPTLFTGSGPYLGEYGISACGIWAGSSSNTLFQYNYCAGTGRIVYDGQAWDFDEKNTGTCIYQYNYSRQNEGGFMLSTQTGPTNNLTMIARNNISVDDGWDQAGGECFFNKYVDLYANNVFYQANVTLSSNTYTAQGFMLPPSNGSTLLGTWENNIFDTTCTVAANNSYAATGRVFTNNCYYHHSPTNPGTGPVLANPQYLNLAEAIVGTAWGDETGFQLAASSPCVNAGTVITSNGGLDYAGNPITSTFKDIGAFLWQTQDIGTVGITGSSSYQNGVFILEGTGNDIWTTSDDFHYVDQHWTGDCITITRITGMTNANNVNAKGGIMYRDSNAANSMFVMLDTKPVGGLEFMARTSTGGSAAMQATVTTGVTPSPTTPIWLKLVRNGSTYTAFYSTSVSTPTTWTQVGGNVSVSFSNATYLDGLVDCSHDNNALLTVVEDNVSISP